MLKKEKYQILTPSNINQLRKIAEISRNKINTGSWYLDENHFIVATNEGLFLYDLEMNLNWPKQKLFENTATEVTLSNDNSILALNNNGFSSDTTLQVGFFCPEFIDLSTMQEYSLGINEDSDSCVMKFNHDNSLFAAASEENIYIWSVDSKNLLFKNEGCGMCWEGMKNCIFFSTWDMEIFHYSLDNKQLTKTYTPETDSFLFPPILDYLNLHKSLLGHFSDSIKLWSSNMIQSTIELDGNTDARTIGVSPDENLIAVIDNSTEMHIIDRLNHQKTYVYDAGYANCADIIFSPNGLFIALVTSKDKVG